MVGKDFITISISIIALAVSFGSCSVSQRAIKITNSPFLALKPIKDDSTKSYLTINPNLTNNSYTLTAKFDITNLGKTPAIDIECLEKPRFNLQPGETHTLVSVMEFKLKNSQDLLTTIDWFHSGKGFVTSDFTVGYSNVFNPGERNKIRVSYNVFENNIVLLKSN